MGKRVYLNGSQIIYKVEQIFIVPIAILLDMIFTPQKVILIYTVTSFLSQTDRTMYILI